MAAMSTPLCPQRHDAAEYHASDAVMAMLTIYCNTAADDAARARGVVVTTDTFLFLFVLAVLRMVGVMVTGIEVSTN